MLLAFAKRFRQRLRTDSYKDYFASLAAAPATRNVIKSVFKRLSQPPQYYQGCWFKFKPEVMGMVHHYTRFHYSLVSASQISSAQS